MQKLYYMYIVHCTYVMSLEFALTRDCLVVTNILDDKMC